MPRTPLQPCIAVCVLLGALSCARAQSPQALDDAALESAYWRCDHAATVVRLDTATVHACSRISERLRVQRFGGDLDAMLAWWRANKAQQHAALASSLRQAAGARRAR